MLSVLDCLKLKFYSNEVEKLIFTEKLNMIKETIFL